jgi:zinc protease
MKRRHDDAETAAWELLQGAVYADTAHARPVIGSVETVSSFSAEDVRRFYEAHYTTSNTLVVVVGDFKTREVLKQLSRELKSMPKGMARGTRPDTQLQPLGARRHAKKHVQQTYGIYGFPTPPAEHPDQEALDLMAVLLGDGRNARLVHTLREEKELVWSIGASNITQESPGIFAIFTEADTKKSPAVGPAVRAVLQGLQKRPPTAEEIQRAKNLIQTSWLQGYETFHNQASTLGAYALENHLKRLENYLPKILGLKAKDLSTIIDNYFSQELCSAVVEP